MKIEQIKVYQVDVPLIEDVYAWAGQRSVSAFDCSVVEILTDSGITGYGEVSNLKVLIVNKDIYIDSFRKIYLQRFAINCMLMTRAKRVN